MKKYIVLWIIMMVIVNLSGCDWHKEKNTLKKYTFTEEGDFEVTSFGNVTLKIENGSLEDDVMSEVAMKVEEASRAADAFLGEYAVTESIICYVHGGNGATSLYGNEIHVFYPENRNVPYTLLMTQSKAGIAGVPDWIRIGVGAYAAAESGECLLDTWARTVDVYQELPRVDADGNEIEYDLDTMAALLLHQEAYMEALQLGDMTEVIAGYEDAQEAYDYRGAYCVSAGSFVKYLDEQYGRDAVMKIYSGSTVKKATGYTRDEVMQAWMQTINTK